MKVILLHDVPKVGKKYDIKEVSSGYARNFLFPRKLAEIATDAKIKSVETTRKRSEQEKEIHKDILEKNIAELDGVTISLSEKANEKGHLFAGIHKDEIAKVLKEQKHIEIPAEIIEMKEPIKEIGEYNVSVGGKKIIVEVRAI